MLSADLCTFLESPCGLIVGTVDAAGEPCCSRAWGCRILDAEGELRLLVGADDPVVAANLASTGRIAITAENPLTMRATQVKGRVRALRPPSADDRARSSRYVDEFFEVISVLDSLNRQVLERVVPPDIIAVDLVVEELYDQTPGPSAGARLAGSRR